VDPVQCVYQLPSGKNLISTLTLYGTRWNATSTLNPRDYSHQALISTFEAIQTPPRNQGRLTTYGWSCSIRWCLRTYANISASNHINSAVVTTQDLWVPTGFSGKVPLSTEFRPESHSDDSGAPKPDEFIIGRYEFDHLRTYFAQMFSMGWFGDGQTGVNFSPDAGFAFSSRYNPLNLIPDAPSPGLALAYETDMDKRMQILATSMTEAIRADAPDSDAVAGTMFVTRTIIHVRWAWLGLPLALVVLSSGLLVVVALQTHRQKVPMWKSEPLALLWHDFAGDGAYDRVPDLAGPLDLENRAKSLRARLGESGERVFVVTEKQVHNTLTSSKQHGRAYKTREELSPSASTS
jgi:hypothetical protein